MLEMISPAPLPLSLQPYDVVSYPTMKCGGIANPIWSRVSRWFSPPSVQSLAYDPNEYTPPFSTQHLLETNAQVTFKKPAGVATFLKSDIDKANANMNWRTSGRTLHDFLAWLCWTLGATGGVGLAYTDSNPHIRLYTLPQSQMRGAIGWMYGPPLGRNRTMQLSQSITTDYYFLRLLQHEFGHFLGHYGSGSHSNRREDIMYPTLQHEKAIRPNYGKSQRDIDWEVSTFGSPWIILN